MSTTQSTLSNTVTPKLLASESLEGVLSQIVGVQNLKKRGVFHSKLRGQGK